MNKQQKDRKMPLLSEHHGTSSVKIMVAGRPKAGKTGSLLALAKAGYELRILDFDNGIDILANELREKNPELLSKVYYETFIDKMKVSSGVEVPDGVPMAFTNGLALLDSWTVKEKKNKEGKIIPGYDLGKPSTWGSNVVIVLDSLTFLCRAALLRARFLNGHGATAPSLPDFGEAQRMIEGALTKLMSLDVACNVVILTHIRTLDKEGEPTICYPEALGKQLPQIVGRFVNNLVLLHAPNAGANNKRVFRTRSLHNFELGVARLDGVPDTLPIETGLATLFSLLSGQKTPEKEAAIAASTAILSKKDEK